MILAAAEKALRAEHPDLYASAFVGVIDPIEMALTYASAGHPPALLRHPDGWVEDLLECGILLGVRVPGSFKEKRVDLFAGSTLVLYTNGLIEESKDIITGQVKLHDLISKHCFPSKTGVAQAIYEAVIPERARDDVAILVVDFISPPSFLSKKKRSNRVSRWGFVTSDAKAAHRTRGEFIKELKAAGAQSDDVFVAELVFGELLGNVVRYAPGPIEVFVDWNGPAPVLHVCDQGAGFFYSPHLPKDPFAENGRGLFIVASMTDEYNVTPMVGQGSHARAVIRITNQPLTHLPLRSRRRRDSNESGTIGAMETPGEKMLIV
jgi:anti-sigma regulatory factor (Ser/Thr protein kinase)